MGRHHAQHIIHHRERVQRFGLAQHSLQLQVEECPQFLCRGSRRSIRSLHLLLTQAFAQLHHHRVITLQVRAQVGQLAALLEQAL